MKGATAEPCVNTIKPPRIIRTKKTGNSQNFFLTFIYLYISAISDIILKLESKTDSPYSQADLFVSSNNFFYLNQNFYPKD